MFAFISTSLFLGSFAFSCNVVVAAGCGSTRKAANYRRLSRPDVDGFFKNLTKEQEDELAQKITER